MRGEEKAAPEEVKQIAQLAGQSVREGAGVSINRLKAHRLPDGRCIPGTLAPVEELVAIAKEVGKQEAFCRA